MRQPALIGRSRELRHAETLLDDPAPRSIVIVGDAGSGRTRLGSEILDRAAKRGMRTAHTTATRAGQAVPLGALSAVLDQMSTVPPEARDTAALLRRAARYLSEDERRLVLLVDDAHLLDDASADLLHQLVLQSGAVVIVTAITGERLPRSLLALWKDGLAERIEVAPFTRSEVEGFIETVVGGQLDRSSVTAFAEHSGGNVLFLHELLLAAQSAGALRSASGGIRYLDGTPCASQRLDDILADRLAPLSADEQHLLEFVAAGEPLGHAQLDALADAATAMRLEELRLIVSDGAAVRMSSPVVAAVVRSRTRPLRARSIAAALADVFERTGGDDAARIAGWRLESGGGDAGQLLAAAHQARGRNAFALAERLVAGSLALEPTFEAALLQAEIVGLLGRAAESERSLIRLVDRAESEADRAAAAVALMDSESFFIGQPQHAVEIADRVAAATTDDRWRSELLARRSTAMLSLHGPRMAAELAAPIMAGEQEAGLSWACLTGSFSLGRLGRLEEAIAVADKGREAFERDGSVAWFPWFHTLHRCDALAHLGRIDEAADLAAAHHQDAIKTGTVEAQTCFALALTKLVVDRGLPGVSERFGREAVGLSVQLGWAQLEYWSRLYLAYALALDGEPEAAESTLGGLDALGLPESETTAVDLMQARAWIAVARGDLVGARRGFTDAALRGESTGDLVGAASAWHGGARIGSPVPDDTVDHLLALEQQIEGPLTMLRRRHVEGLIEDSSDTLADAAAGFADAGALMLAAEATADASGAARRAGRVAEADDLAARARAISRRCGEPVTPALGATELRTRLTEAERRVALAAGEGLSNRAIAETHFLSVRTVETHLRRVYRKLGINQRSELAQALGLSPNGGPA